MHSDGTVVGFIRDGRLVIMRTVDLYIILHNEGRHFQLVDVNQIVQILNPADKVYFIPDTCGVSHQKEPGNDALPYRPVDYVESVHVSAIFYVQQFIKVFEKCQI